MNQNQSESRIESAEVVLHFHLKSLNWNAFMIYIYICLSLSLSLSLSIYIYINPMPAINRKVWCEVEQGHGGWPRLQRHGWSQEVGHHSWWTWQEIRCSEEGWGHHQVRRWFLLRKGGWYLCASLDAFPFFGGWGGGAQTPTWRVLTPARGLIPKCTSCLAWGRDTASAGIIMEAWRTVTAPHKDSCSTSMFCLTQRDRLCRNLVTSGDQWLLHEYEVQVHRPRHQHLLLRGSIGVVTWKHHHAWHAENQGQMPKLFCDWMISVDFLICKWLEATIPQQAARFSIFSMLCHFGRRWNGQQRKWRGPTSVESFWAPQTPLVLQRDLCVKRSTANGLS